MFEEIKGVLMQSYETFFNELAAFLPNIIGALLILIIGWIIAKLIKTAAIRLLKLIRLDVVTEKAKIDKFLKICNRHFRWYYLLAHYVNSNIGRFKHIGIRSSV